MMYLFPEGFSNVGVVFTDVTRYHNSIFRQGQCHAQRVVACVHSCKYAPNSEKNKTILDFSSRIDHISLT